MQNKNLNLLINAGGILTGLFVFGYVIWSYFHTEQAEPCTARYPAPMRMTALAPDRLRAVVAEHGGEVVDSVSKDIPVSHWRSTSYVVRKR